MKLKTLSKSYMESCSDMPERLVKLSAPPIAAYCSESGPGDGEVDITNALRILEKAKEDFDFSTEGSRAKSDVWVAKMLFSYLRPPLGMTTEQFAYIVMVEYEKSVSEGKVPYLVARWQALKKRPGHSEKTPYVAVKRLFGRVNDQCLGRLIGIMHRTCVNGQLMPAAATQQEPIQTLLGNEYMCYHCFARVLMDEILYHIEAGDIVSTNLSAFSKQINAILGHVPVEGIVDYQSDPEAYEVWRRSAPAPDALLVELPDDSGPMDTIVLPGYQAALQTRVFKLVNHDLVAAARHRRDIYWSARNALLERIIKPLRKADASPAQVRNLVLSAVDHLADRLDEIRGKERRDRSSKDLESIAAPFLGDDPGENFDNATKIADGLVKLFGRQETSVLEGMKPDVLAVLQTYMNAAEDYLAGQSGPPKDKPKSGKAGLLLKDVETSPEAKAQAVKISELFFTKGLQAFTIEKSLGIEGHRGNSVQRAAKKLPELARVGIIDASWIAKTLGICKDLQSSFPTALIRHRLTETNAQNILERAKKYELEKFHQAS